MFPVASDMRETVHLSEDVEAVGRSIRCHVAAALEHVEAVCAAKVDLSDAFAALRDCRTRIEETVDGMGTERTRWHAVEARLCFETARLRRSDQRVRAAQEDLQRAQAVLSRKARRARDLAASADRTARLIAAIDAALACGEPVDALLAEGDRLLAEGRARTMDI